MTLSSSFLFLILFLIQIPALAAGGDYDYKHNVSVAGGIVSPSTTSALYENPSGLSNLRSSKLSINGDTNNNSLQVIGTGATLNMTTNGVLGFGLGIQHAFLKDASSVSSTYAHLGAGYYISELRLALGASGSYRLKDSQSILGTKWDSNFGITLFPRNTFSFGLMAYSVIEGPDAYGAGIELDLSQNLTFVMDASTNQDLRGLRILPSLAFQSGAFSVNYGYGVEIDDTQSGSPLQKEHVVGVGLMMGRSLSVQGYYNHLNKYFVNLTLRL